MDEGVAQLYVGEIRELEHLGSKSKKLTLNDQARPSAVQIAALEQSRLTRIGR